MDPLFIRYSRTCVCSETCKIIVGVGGSYSVDVAFAFAFLERYISAKLIYGLRHWSSDRLGMGIGHVSEGIKFGHKHAACIRSFSMVGPVGVETRVLQLEKKKGNPLVRELRNATACQIFDWSTCRLKKMTEYPVGWRTCAVELGSGMGV